MAVFGFLFYLLLGSSVATIANTPNSQADNKGVFNLSNNYKNGEEKNDILNKSVNSFYIPINSSNAKVLPLSHLRMKAIQQYTKRFANLNQKNLGFGTDNTTYRDIMFVDEINSTRQAHLTSNRTKSTAHKIKSIASFGETTKLTTTTIHSNDAIRLPIRPSSMSTPTTSAFRSNYSYKTSISGTTESKYLQSTLKTTKNLQGTYKVSQSTESKFSSTKYPNSNNTSLTTVKTTSDSTINPCPISNSTTTEVPTTHSTIKPSSTDGMAARKGFAAISILTSITFLFDVVSYIFVRCQDRRSQSMRIL